MTPLAATHRSAVPTEVMNWPELPPCPYLDFSVPGNVRVKGTRVQLEIVVDDYLEGREADEIARDYPSLSLEAVYGVLAYYHGHRQIVDRYLARIAERDEALEREHDRQPDPPVVARIKALRTAKYPA